MTTATLTLYESDDPYSARFRVNYKAYYLPALTLILLNKINVDPKIKLNERKIAAYVSIFKGMNQYIFKVY